MLTFTPDLAEMAETRRSDREAEAAPERLRQRRGFRCRAALLLRQLADRLAPELAVPGDGELAGHGT